MDDTPIPEKPLFGTIPCPSHWIRKRRNMTLNKAIRDAEECKEYYEYRTSQILEIHDTVQPALYGFLYCFLIMDVANMEWEIFMLNQIPTVSTTHIGKNKMIDQMEHDLILTERMLTVLKWMEHNDFSFKKIGDDWKVVVYYE